MPQANTRPIHGPDFEPTGLAEWFHRRALRGPERPALSFEHSTWSYADTQAQVERCAAVLHQQGLRRGERVAYLGINHPIVFVLLLAAARLGAVLVPLNHRLASHELVGILQDAEAHTLVTDTQYLPLADSLRAQLSCSSYLCLGSEAPGWQSMETALHSVATFPSAVTCHPDEVVLLVYTSGTSGRPKGVMLTHGNLWTNNLNWLLACDFVSTDVTLNCAPLFHVGGLCVVSLPTLLCGGHLIVQAGFEPGAFIDAIEEQQVSVTFGVPAMMLFASQHSRFAQADLSSLRLVVAGGAPVPEPLLRVYQARQIPVSQCYGMTEATSGGTFLETHRALSKLGSCGREGMLTQVRLIDAQGAVITEPHVRGEICMRGGNVTPGYWKLPDTTAQAKDAEGWLRTGDGAYFDEEGFYYICDRLKDMVISGGENVYPAEVEAALYEHPAIAEVAVVGAEDETWGERVVAVVVFKPGQTLSLETLQAHCKDRLARYKQPRELRVLPALPRNANGKVDKVALRRLSAA
jgi:fatty-acyl-CoA synthase